MDYGAGHKALTFEIARTIPLCSLVYEAMLVLTPQEFDAFFAEHGPIPTHDTILSCEYDTWLRTGMQKLRERKVPNKLRRRADAAEIAMNSEKTKPLASATTECDTKALARIRAKLHDRLGCEERMQRAMLRADPLPVRLRRGFSYIFGEERSVRVISIGFVILLVASLGGCWYKMKIGEAEWIAAGCPCAAWLGLGAEGCPPPVDCEERINQVGDAAVKDWLSRHPIGY